MLGRLRFPVEQTRGRRYPESAHPYRNAFQRDRDRIVHSRAFRRLEAKTQVFPPGLSDHFRNRLTHTIEVAQMARTAARVLSLDEDLTEALALAHDIGHPPFAHAGEEALDTEMRRFADRFDHNLHALRLVETFEQRYACFPGLNLTYEMREGMVKHSRDFERGESPELDRYAPGLRPTLEAQLIDLADEIAYNTGDLDDVCSAGLLRVEEAAEAVPLCGAIFEAVETQYPGATVRERFQEGLRRLVDTFITSLIEGTADHARRAGVATFAEVPAHPTRLAALTPEAAEASAAFKRFLLGRVYSSAELVAERRHSMGMIAALFGYFVDDPRRLPDGYAQAALEAPPHRVVCDYLAGMTDGFFRRTYEQAFGVNPRLE